MGRRYTRLGLGGQVKYPRIRGALSSSHEQRRFIKEDARLEDFKADEETYFVPSFSIRRHLHRSEEMLWETQQQIMKRRLGRGFRVLPAEEVTLKTVEQKRFIKTMRTAGIHPKPEEMRDLAYSIRDILTNVLSNARSPLAVPLGDFNRFGEDDNVLGYEIEGWRGDRANYGPNDHDGYMDTYSVLLAERQLSVGTIALAFPEVEFRAVNLLQSPHVTIARGKDTIPEYRMRSFGKELGVLAVDQAVFGDPIIEAKLYRDMPAERIPVRQAWESLAPMPGLTLPDNVPSIGWQDYERYDELGSLYA